MALRNKPLTDQVSPGDEDLQLASLFLDDDIEPGLSWQRSMEPTSRTVSIWRLANWRAEK